MKKSVLVSKRRLRRPKDSRNWRTSFKKFEIFIEMKNKGAWELSGLDGKTEFNEIQIEANELLREIEQSFSSIKMTLEEV